MSSFNAVPAQPASSIEASHDDREHLVQPYILHLLHGAKSGTRRPSLLHFPHLQGERKASEVKQGQLPLLRGEPTDLTLSLSDLSRSP